MNRSMYIAASALLLNQKRIDVISNNLANANTKGFKKDIVISEAFPEVLLSKINDRIDMDNHKAFRGVNVQVEEDAYTLSINSGYFKVRTPAGVGYSRDLKFIIDDNGYLKTHYKDLNAQNKTDGENYVLGQNGPIRVEDRNIEIDNRGNVISNGQIVDNLITFTPFNVIGTTSGGVRLDKVGIDYTEGTLIETGNKLDLALKGDGFFSIETPEGIRYTRDGSFTLNSNGELVTKEGYAVLGQYGPIVLSHNSFDINENGDIIVEGQVENSLVIVSFDNKEYLRKQGNNLYAVLENVDPGETEFVGQVLSGYLEASNVDTIKEMVSMITAYRSYESSQKVIKTQDELLEKIVNELGRV
ncbi:flagellar basal-body rod protein FlgG [Proteiniborus ethanoligenes]|uniref:Flagellar basal-body rod protein FlgG n=1 Tax=Proteiniborus ethanoligenes TaxID=415015 RepID=A0A1H3LQM5_9FIRM|nr:flagellar hook-basal body protein [Proteiniborus ethanoligenes]SDY66867.1 flagellar basal-body rod protein FlgG [Proteiniborus ethanoligenes]